MDADLPDMNISAGGGNLGSAYNAARLYVLTNRSIPLGMSLETVTAQMEELAQLDDGTKEKFFRHGLKVVHALAYDAMGPYRAKFGSDIEDLVQELVISVVGRIDRFRQVTSDYRDDFADFLCKSAKNRANSHYRKIMAESEFPLRSNDEDPKATEMFEEVETRVVWEKRLPLYLSLLDTIEARVICMRYRYNGSGQEIAERLGIDYGEVKSKICSGRKKLNIIHSILEQYNVDNMTPRWAMAIVRRAQRSMDLAADDETVSGDGIALAATYGERLDFYFSLMGTYDAMAVKLSELQHKQDSEIAAELGVAEWYVPRKIQKGLERLATIHEVLQKQDLTQLTLREARALLRHRNKNGPKTSDSGQERLKVA